MSFKCDALIGGECPNLATEFFIAKDPELTNDGESSLIVRCKKHSFKQSLNYQRYPNSYQEITKEEAEVWEILKL